MKPEWFAQLEVFFEEASGLAPAQRAPVLRRASETGPALEEELRRMLAAHDAGDGAAPAPSVATEARHIQPARRYGPWITGRLLGRGGMGSVFLARRDDGQYEREVALKVLAAHLADDSFHQRFLAERQILAELSHPNITGMLDGGVGEDGSPYLVMEYVDGEPLDHWCDSRRLGLEDRVRLFQQVCGAVSHAHSRLVLHRDLKPSNILVDKEGQARLLDFGAAKLLSGAGRGVTMTGAALMTPRYASPEQMRQRNVGTQSDIYSLGVVLYELLAGVGPFGESGGSPLADFLRLAENRAPAPLGSELGPDAAANRGMPENRLLARLRGDLRSICAKALAVETTQRYLTVEELAADLRRYLAGEPVEAHEPGFAYRLGKFVSRNAKAVAASAVACALLAGTGAYAWRERIQGAERLEEARSMANYLLFDLYDRVNELPGSTALRARMAGEAQARLDRLAALSGASVELRLEAATGYNRLAEIQGISGSSSRGGTQAAAENLAKARRIVDGILAAEPGHRSALIQRAANSLLSAKLQNWNRRNTKAARPAIEQARRDLEASKDPSSPRWADVSAVLAIQDADLAEFDRDFAGEERIAQAALDRLAAGPPPPEGAADAVLRRVALLKRRGNALYGLSRFEGALASYQEAHSLLQKAAVRNPNHPELLYASMDMSYQMAYSYGELGQPGQMLDSTMDSLRTAERLVALDTENQALRRSYWNKRQALAESLAVLGRFEDSIREQQTVLEARKEARAAQPDSNLADENVEVTQSTLAGILARAGQRDRACQLARRTMESSEALHRAGGMTEKTWAGQRTSLGPVLSACTVK